jgi:hypothetical protein
VNINNLFPTPVAFFKFGRDLTEAELEFIIGQVRLPERRKYDQ